MTARPESGTDRARDAEHRPAVSVIVRNRNEAEYLALVLAALRAQRGVAAEIILVDNASTDASVALASEYGARVVSIARGAFTYGRALNVGLAEATAEICVILSAHAMPLGPWFLAECARAFDAPEVAAVRCVRVDKRFDMERWITPRRLQGVVDVDTVVSLGPLASGCAIRRSVWERVPFDEQVAAAEDKLWAAAVLEAGHVIVSPCPAFYLYLKRVSGEAAVRKNYGELLAVYDATGVPLGLLRRGVAGTVLVAVRGVLAGTARHALSMTRREAAAVVLRARATRRGRHAPHRARPP